MIETIRTNEELEKISYAIFKECSRHNLDEFCEVNGFTTSCIFEFFNLAEDGLVIKKFNEVKIGDVLNGEAWQSQ